MKDVRRLVVKIGTNCLVDDSGCFKRDVASNIARDIAELKRQGKEILLVSSGAVALGRANSAIGSKWRAINETGHRILQERHAEAFAEVDLAVRYRLLDLLRLNRGDIDLGEQEMLFRLAAADKAIGILNGNHSGKFLNNDRLAAIVAEITYAQAVILLSNVDGLLDREGNRVDLVEQIDDEVLGMVNGSKSENGTGGMASKLKVFKENKTRFKIIANAKEDSVLQRVLVGEDLGTLFV